MEHCKAEMSTMLQHTKDMHSNQSPLLLGALHLTVQIAKYSFIHTFMYIITKAGHQHLMSILKGSQRTYTVTVSLL